MDKIKISNIAFIDGQNLHLGTTQDGWKVDLKKLRIYLKDKYHIVEAYYFLGYVTETEQDLYNNLQRYRDFASSLYKHFGAEFFDYLYNIKTYIEWHKKEKGS